MAVDRFAAALACVVATVLWGGAAAAPVAPVGSDVCRPCHASEYLQWQGSHHQLAMQPATRASVLAPFRGESVRRDGTTSRFDGRGGRFQITTQDPHGVVRTFAVTYVLGVAPLQQYLVPLPDGSLHAFEWAWDTRPAAAGGQRWFTPASGVGSGPAPPPWTGPTMNWNLACADCHVTGYRKRFDTASSRYRSEWSEAGVGCEACHGNGAAHVAWARRRNATPTPATGAGYREANAADPSHGWRVRFDERLGVRWTIQADTGNALRTPRGPASDKEVSLCARCHAHRAQIAEGDAADPLLDDYLPSLLQRPLYWPDGQMRAEVYNYGSFVQSRMHGKGVTCSDCHDPHSQKLRAPGNGVCLQCHAEAKYATAAHHFHDARGPGGQCVACHMPTTLYMSIDARHDHDIRIPNPQLSVRVGSPDACSACHRDKAPGWASEVLARRYPEPATRPLPGAFAVFAFDRGDAQAWELATAQLSQAAVAGFVKASLLTRMAAESPDRTWPLAQSQLANADALVRRAAIECLATAPLRLRLEQLVPLLDDPVRGVRMAAARALADAPPEALGTPAHTRATEVLAEYEASERFNADRPESYVNLAGLYADQGRLAQARAALERALRMDPASSAVHLDLADLERAQGDEHAAQTELERAIKLDPASGGARFALALLLWREQRKTEAVAALAQAVALTPENPRFWTAYISALQASGQTARARTALTRAQQLHPASSEIAALAAGLPAP